MIAYIDNQEALEHGVDLGCAQDVTVLGAMDETNTGTPVPTYVGTGEDVIVQDYQQGTDQPEQVDLPGGTTVYGHNHVPPRPANWDLEAKPFATYKLASGDTFAGLAVTYLGDGTRAQEIYNTGSNRSKMPSMNPPNSWWQSHVGPIVLDMPDEARDNMIAWIKKGKPSNQKPGAIPPSEVKSLNSRTWKLAAAGVGVAAVIGYFALR